MNKSVAIVLRFWYAGGMAKTGRPKKEIDQKAFEGLCALQCTIGEMCEFFHTTDKTLDKWCKETYSKSFSEIFKVKRGAGKISLRRTGFELAKTNGSVWIFLAKNHLGMRDNPEQAEAEVAQSIQYTIVVESARKDKSQNKSE